MYLDRFLLRSRKQNPWTLVHYFHRLRCEIGLTKMHFLGMLYLGRQGMLRPEIFTRSRDWPRLPSAHSHWDGSPPKKFKSWKLKVGLQIQRINHYNLEASGSILTKHFPYDVSRGRGHNIPMYNFWKAGPLKCVRAKETSKIQRDFWQLSTLIANISGTIPDIQNMKKCDRQRFLSRSMKKVRWTLVNKQKSFIG